MKAGTPKNETASKWIDADDDEILEAIQEAIQDDGRLNPDYIDVEVVNGSVTLSGRVASEEELQIVEEVLEGIRIENYKNKIWMDDNLGYDDSDEEDNGFKGLSFEDDDEIEEAEYSGEDSDNNDN